MKSKLMKMDKHRIVKHVIIIIMIAVGFGFIYSLMPKEYFNFEDPLDPYYFSFTTMSTAGYGDMLPKTTKAKMLVMVEQMIIMTGVITMIFE